MVYKAYTKISEKLHRLITDLSKSSFELDLKFIKFVSMVLDRKILGKKSSIKWTQQSNVSPDTRLPTCLSLILTTQLLMCHS